jgi:hypothetical protein
MVIESATAVFVYCSVKNANSHFKAVKLIVVAQPQQKNYYSDALVKKWRW